MGGHDVISPLPEPGSGSYTSEKTTTWSPCRNISRGQPSSLSEDSARRDAAGQERCRYSFCPERTKMRVPSFFTKSASSTPSTWLLVPVWSVGPEVGLPPEPGALGAP